MISVFTIRSAAQLYPVHEHACITGPTVRLDGVSRRTVRVASPAV
jgi:hypothetical protein